MTTRPHEAADAIPSATRERARRTPSRRTVLRALAVGAAGVGGALTWRATTQDMWTPDTGPQLDAWSQLAHAHGIDGLAAAAVLAASAHNIQNWHLVVSPTRIDLVDDTTRSIGVVDPWRREAHLGLGCALANLELAGPPHGFQVRTELDPSGGARDRVATLALTPVAVGDADPLYAAIPARHSDRGPYPAELPARATLERIGALAVDGSGPVRIVWLTSESERSTAGQLLVDAAQGLVDDVAMSIDNAAWMRYDARQIRKTKDGLTLDAQALSPVVEIAAKLLPPVSRSRGDAAWVSMTRDVHTATARAYGLVLADRGSVASRLRAGRALQRLHLGLTLDGWAMQHMNQAVEMTEREESTGRPASFGDRLSGIANGSEVVAMVRVGRPSSRAVRSPRRPVSEVLL